MSGENIRLKWYEGGNAAQWDHLVRTSKNGTFLLERSYMDYHNDRFRDASLMAFGSAPDKLLAVLPACFITHEGGAWLSSHAGLTYGGWVSDARMTTRTMLEIFEMTRRCLRENDLCGLIYKAIPRVFQKSCADEDLYAAFRSGGVISHVEAGAAIDIQAPFAWSKGKRHGLAKARRAEVTVGEFNAFDDFVLMLRQALAKHNAAPVHSAEELTLLKSRFQDRIRLFTARLPNDPDFVAAVLVFDCGPTIHTQYMASSERGRQVGALESIIDHLVRETFPDRRYLSLGVSSTERGQVLNEGLMMQKEMMGARSVAHMTLRLAATP